MACFSTAGHGQAAGAVVRTCLASGDDSIHAGRALTVAPAIAGVEGDESPLEDVELGQANETAAGNALPSPDGVWGEEIFEDGTATQGIDASAATQGGPVQGAAANIVAWRRDNALGAAEAPARVWQTEHSDALLFLMELIGIVASLPRLPGRLWRGRRHIWVCLRMACGPEGDRLKVLVILFLLVVFALLVLHVVLQGLDSLAIMLGITVLGMMTYTACDLAMIVAVKAYDRQQRSVRQDYIERECPSRRLERDVSEEEVCVVCLNAIQQGENCRVMNCGHMFHSECIDDWWLRQEGTTLALKCPICRQRQPINAPSGIVV